MKNKVLLFQPKSDTQLAVYPLGCLYLSSFLIKNGFNPLIFDHNDFDNYQGFIDKHINEALCVGISCITGSQIGYALDIASYIKKKAKDMPLVWGGRHPSALPAQTLEDERVDFVVRGEGEETFLELVSSLVNKGKDFRNIKGLSFKKDNDIIHNSDREVIDLDNFPTLPWHLLDIEYKLSKAKERSISIQTGRDCVYTCTFCSHRKVRPEVYRGFSPAYIFDNLEPLIKRHNIEMVYFFEPYFIFRQERIEEFCREIIKRNLKIKWSGSSRANTFVSYSPDFYGLLKESGCSEIGFGFESGSERILKKIDKRITVPQIIESARLCSQYDIRLVANFMTGFPFEKFWDTAKTLAVINKIKHLCAKVVFHMQLYMPLPATILYEECHKEYGLQKVDSLKNWGKPGLWRRKLPWLNPIKKLSSKLLSAIVYISEKDYINTRSDMPLKWPVSLIINFFLEANSLLFAGPFKKEGLAKNRRDEKRETDKKILFISSLYPNVEQPTRAVYNLQQIKGLAKLCSVKVIAPYFWFPFLKIGNKGARLDKIPFYEKIDGIEVWHPKVFYLPKIGPLFTGFFYFLSLQKLFKKYRDIFDCDYIYTNWLYPDGFGVMLFSRYINKPYAIAGLGTDINEYLKFPIRKKMIRAALSKAKEVIVVSFALKKQLQHYGIRREIHVLHNGKDGEIFRLRDKNTVRQSLGLKGDERFILYVGNFEEWKGLDYLIHAVSLLQKNKDSRCLKLYLIGAGQFENKMRELIQELSLENNISFLGPRSHKEIGLWMNAAEFLCLPSINEGLSNVIIEAISCGLPVIATKVGGIPEIVTEEKLGVLVKPCDAEDLASAIKSADKKKWDRAAISKYEKIFSWDENAKHLYEIIFK
jgi:glycosyltransferase involved in cell wall biosynthesis/radical SAM superfamily enzyme YgiQ (UPF0313 family)